MMLYLDAYLYIYGQTMAQYGSSRVDRSVEPAGIIKREAQTGCS